MDSQYLKNLFATSLLENMTKVKSLVLIASAILYTDCTLSITFRKNIQSFDWGAISFSENLFHLVAFFFLYCALASFLLPALQHILIILISMPPKILPTAADKRLFNAKTDVSIYALRRYAEKENNTVILRICEKFEEGRQHASEMSKHTFFVLVLILFNWIILGDDSNKTILQSFGDIDAIIKSAVLNSVRESGFSGAIGFLIAKFFMFFIGLLLLFFPCAWCYYTFGEQPDYIINPELAKIVNATKIKEADDNIPSKIKFSMKAHDEYQ